MSARRCSAPVSRKRLFGGGAERCASRPKTVLRASIKAGGSSLRDHKKPDGELGIPAQFLDPGREGSHVPY